MEWDFPAECLAIHAGLVDRFPVAGDQIIAQPVQIPQPAGGLIGYGGILDTVSVVLVAIFPLGQRLDIIPVGRLELPVGGGWIGQWLGQWGSPPGFFQ